MDPEVPPCSKIIYISHHFILFHKKKNISFIPLCNCPTRTSPPPCFLPGWHISHNHAFYPCTTHLSRHCDHPICSTPSHASCRDGSYRRSGHHWQNNTIPVHSSFHSAILPRTCPHWSFSSCLCLPSDGVATLQSTRLHSRICTALSLASCPSLVHPRSGRPPSMCTCPFDEASPSPSSPRTDLHFQGLLCPFHTCVLPGNPHSRWGSGLIGSPHLWVFLPSTALPPALLRCSGRCLLHLSNHAKNDLHSTSHPHSIPLLPLICDHLSTYLHTSYPPHSPVYQCPA